MTDGDNIAQVAVVILLLSLSVPALATAYDYAGTPIAQEETATVDVGNATAVSAYATDTERYGETVVITTDGQQLVAGADYRWNSTSGEVTWLSSTNTTDGESATIEYDAHQRTRQTEIAWQVIMPFTGLFGLFGFVAAIRALWSYIAEVWNFT